ncbi:MAG: MGMT family protein [Acidobacteria bacterium]|nr:MGMT family protein [Acidobacteriota bacterium]
MSWSVVHSFVKRIPRGRVVTYGQLARALKLPGGARTAGRAMFACPSGRGIPWHRVVGAGGRILIREPQASLQRKLLESEGTRFAGSRVDIAAHQWNPPRRLQKTARVKSFRMR